MTYVDYYFKFDSKSQFEKSFKDVFIDSYINVVEVGLIEGVEGYHVNVRVPDTTKIGLEEESFRIEAPKTPKSVWAGDVVDEF